MRAERQWEKNSKVIIIDDDPGIRETYQSILAPTSHHELLAEGASLFGDTEPKTRVMDRDRFELTLIDRGDKGVAAVKAAIADEAPFAVAFIDMKMPGLEGAETAKRIWEIDPDIKIIFVTAFSEHTPDDINRITGRDDSFYLRKPFNPEEIRQFARALTNEWTLEKEREKLSADLRMANSALEDVNQTLNDRVKQQTAMLVQSEKMASIGILAAGVAHEINTPITFINGNLTTLIKYCTRITHLLGYYASLEQLLAKEGNSVIQEKLVDLNEFKTAQKIEYVLNDIRDLVIESQEGAERIQKIVLDLKTFSRADETEYKYADLHDMIDTTLSMLNNEMPQGTQVIRNYDPQLVQIKCYSQKLSQVLMNLLINAIQAINENGVITIGTQVLRTGQRRADEKVELKISDNGCGIEEQNLIRLFDPFFTTKPVGEGTGLGLSMSYDIIKSHGGDISVASQVGKGTTVTVLLPLEMEN